ncbi:MAG: response regulator [Bacteroidales bacterium]
MVRSAIILFVFLTLQFSSVANLLVLVAPKANTAESVKPESIPESRPTYSNYENTNTHQQAQTLEKNWLYSTPTLKHIIVIVSLAFLVLLAVSLLFIIQYRNKIRELKKINDETKHINSHLETIVELRTQDLLETQKKAQENSKQKSAFLANISHEIRTPLNAILGFSKFLNDDNLNKTERKQYVELIMRRGKNLQQIVNDIINLSLIDAGMVYLKTEPFNLNQLLYDLYKMFSSNSLFRKHPQIEFKLTVALNDSRSIIISDPGKVEQVLNNLLTNAFNYTNQGTIELGYELTPSNRIKLFVKDTGVGISQAVKEQVFSNAKRVNHNLQNQNHGLGLGLPICKGLTDLFGGKMNIETTPKGTTVSFSVPYIPGKQETKSYISRLAVQNLSFSNKLILVVEDDLISFQLIEAMLKNTGARLIHAKNGEDAIEIAKLKKDINLIIMDMRLPFIDGYEATQAIKKIKPNVPIVAQTANAMGYDRDKCLKAGCDEYIPKPIDPDEFLRTVANFIG